jgi:hypothetical protein
MGRVIGTSWEKGRESGSVVHFETSNSAGSSGISLEYCSIPEVDWDLGTGALENAGRAQTVLGEMASEKRIFLKRTSRISR